MSVSCFVLFVLSLVLGLELGWRFGAGVDVCAAVVVRACDGYGAACGVGALGDAGVVLGCCYRSYRSDGMVAAGVSGLMEGVSYGCYGAVDGNQAGRVGAGGV